MPEIYDGIVEIKSVAREPGMRSKIAVSSREPGLDPVGACVGPKGSRVRMVVGELRGERIDVVPWNDDPATFVANALSPAKVDRVLIDEDTHTATVIVPDDQLSLAIGKEGQNARLAAKLTGWRIDIKSASHGRRAGHRRAAGRRQRGRAEEFDGRCCRGHRIRRALPQPGAPRQLLLRSAREGGRRRVMKAAQDSRRAPASGAATSSDKREFVRVVRTPDGDVDGRPDRQGQRARSVPVRDDLECFEAAAQAPASRLGTAGEPERRRLRHGCDETSTSCSSDEQSSQQGR